MSVEPVYSEHDEARLKAARAEDMKVKPEDIHPPLRAIGWDVRWRQVRSTMDTSLRMLASEGRTANDAFELNYAIKRLKRENNGIAYKHIVQERLSGYRESETLEEFLLGDFTKHVLTLKPATQRQYAQAIDNRILYRMVYRTAEDGRRERLDQKTNIATMPIRDIGGQHLVEWWRQMVADNGGRSRIVDMAVETLRSGFSYAVELDRIDRNPIRGLRTLVGRGGTRKAATVKRGQVIDPLVIERIRRVAELRGAFRDELMVGLAAYAGLRPNEQAVLFLKEVLNDDGTARDEIVIERGESHGVEVDVPKNGDWRVVKIFRPLKASIERYYKAIGSPPLEERFYLTRTGGRMSAKMVSTAITRTARHAGVDLRPYDLRHTAASLLANGGDEAKPGERWSWAAVGRHVGHSPGVSERIYQHAVPNPRWRGMPIEQVIEEARAEAVRDLPDGSVAVDRRSTIHRRRPR